MPYKDPERKRQWERDNREQRNAKRRKPFDVRVRIARILRNRTPDPVRAPEEKSGWKVLLGFAVGLGVVVLATNPGNIGSRQP